MGEARTMFRRFLSPFNNFIERGIAFVFLFSSSPLYLSGD